MANSQQTPEFLATLAKALLRGWIFAIVLLLVWFGLYKLGGDFFYQMQGDLFGLSRHELDLITYCGMGLTKILALLFLFIPWLAIRVLLGKTKE